MNFSYKEIWYEKIKISADLSYHAYSRHHFIVCMVYDLYIFLYFLLWYKIYVFRDFNLYYSSGRLVRAIRDFNFDPRGSPEGNCTLRIQLLHRIKTYKEWMKVTILYNFFLFYVFTFYSQSFEENAFKISPRLLCWSEPVHSLR